MKYFIIFILMFTAVAASGQKTFQMEYEFIVSEYLGQKVIEKSPGVVRVIGGAYKIMFNNGLSRTVDIIHDEESSMSAEVAGNTYRQDHYNDIYGRKALVVAWKNEKPLQVTVYDDDTKQIFVPDNVGEFTEVFN